MPRRRAVLEISPTRLEVTVSDGNAAASSKAERVSFAEYNESWPKPMESFSAALTALVQNVGAAGAETTIIYTAPTSAVVTTAVPANAGPKQAMQAARLALGDAANRSLAGNPHDLGRMWRDEDDSAEQAQHAHVLSFADAEETAVAIVRAARAAGLSPLGLIPAESVGFLAAIDTALEKSKATPEAVIVLYCGEHISTLAAATKGRLRFVRRVGISVELLIDALAREICPTTPGAAPVTLTHDQAAEVLFRRGIPVRGQEFDPQTGLDADSVLPLVQPVLQRCIVELRQSLRFGLEEAERTGARLVVLGMGSRIGRLPQLIAEQTAMNLTNQDPASAGESAPSSSSAGLIHEWSSGRQFPMRLVPASLRREQTARGVRRGMFVGFAAAAALVVFAAVSVQMDLSSQGGRINAAKTRLENAQPLTEQNTRLMALQGGIASAKQRMVARLSTAAPWDAAMAALAQCTPPTVKITECAMIFDKGKPICRLNGRTPLPVTGDANAVMRSFLDSLATVPLVKSTRLGATQRADSEIGPIQSFEMTITLVDIPAFAGDARPDLATLQPDAENP